MLLRSTLLTLVPLLAACSVGATVAQPPPDPPTADAAAARIEAFHEVRTSRTEEEVDRFCDEAYGRCPVGFRPDTWEVAPAPIEVRCSFTLPGAPAYRVVVVESELASGERLLGQVRTRVMSDGRVAVGDDYANGALLTGLRASGSDVSMSWTGANPALPDHEPNQTRIASSCEDPEAFVAQVTEGGPVGKATAVESAG